MRATLIAVGTRQPRWVDAAYEDYARRLRTSLPLELLELETAARGKSSNGNALRARAAEARDILASAQGRGHLVALDEHGRLRNTQQLADWLDKRRQMGTDLCFVIGGPDGLDASILKHSGEQWSLSPLTLPHGLVRVLLAEQLYRASSLLAGHPYHRA
jgi:23S rRNA (pseudouridine1915-N3)-methyltransferase